MSKNNKTKSKNKLRRRQQNGVGGVWVGGLKNKQITSVYKCRLVWEDTR